jgi:uncharacterized protein YjbI with pentapeptide repeats
VKKETLASWLVRQPREDASESIGVYVSDVTCQGLSWSHDHSLVRSYLKKVVFRDVTLSHTDWTWSVWEHCTFENVALHGLQSKYYSYFVFVKFSKCRINAIFLPGIFLNSEFINCYIGKGCFGGMMEQNTFIESNFDEINFSANLSATTFTSCTLTKCRFDGQATSAKFIGSTLKECEFSGLLSIYFERCYIKGIMFANCFFAEDMKKQLAQEIIRQAVEDGCYVKIHSANSKLSVLKAPIGKGLRVWAESLGSLLKASIIEGANNYIIEFESELYDLVAE